MNSQAPVIQAEYEQLDNIAAKFLGQSEQVHGASQSIGQMVDLLQDGGWHGRAADAFFAEMDAIVFPGIQRLTAALEKASEVTLQIKSILQGAEQEAASLFGGESAEQIQVSGQAGAAVEQPAVILERNTITSFEAPSPVDALRNVLEAPPYDYALFSNAAYTNDGALPQSLIDKGWEKATVGGTETGYYGIAYVNFEQKEIVIAHRGTDDRNDLDDDAQLALGRTPDQFYESLEFVNRVHDQAKEANVSHFQVTHTGHSLGAVLADLHAADNGQQAITFDNPGSKPLFADAGLGYDPNDHIAYQSNPNLINQTNHPAGHERYIRLQTESGKFDPIRNTLHDHSLDNILAAFDPETGFPRGYQ